MTNYMWDRVTGFPPSILQLRNESISERTNARYYNKETTTAIMSLLFLRNLMPWRKATNMFYALQHCVGASIVGCHLVTKRLSRTEYGTDCVSVWPFSTLVRCTPYQLKRIEYFSRSRFSQTGSWLTNETQLLQPFTFWRVDVLIFEKIMDYCLSVHLLHNKVYKIKVKVFFNLNLLILHYR